MAYSIPWGPDLAFLRGDFDQEQIEDLGNALATLPWLLRERVIRSRWACNGVDLTGIERDSLPEPRQLIKEMNQSACEIGQANERLQLENKLLRAMLTMNRMSLPAEAAPLLSRLQELGYDPISETPLGPALPGPVALRNEGIDLSRMKRWDLRTSPTEDTEYTDSASTLLVIEYGDGTKTEFKGEAAGLLISHISDRAEATIWRFRYEPTFPTPAERAIEAWMNWLRQDEQAITDKQFVRIVERCIREALRADDARRVKITQANTAKAGLSETEGVAN